MSNTLSPRNGNREWDDNALRASLCKPPCRTCKKEQTGIELQYYCLCKPRSNSFINRQPQLLILCNKKWILTGFFGSLFKSQPIEVQSSSHSAKLSAKDESMIELQVTIFQNDQIFVSFFQNLASVCSMKHNLRSNYLLCQSYRVTQPQCSQGVQVFGKKFCQFF